MANWQLTPGLANLRRQFDAAFPNRDKTSDGTIGDAAHQAGTSGHNPDDSPGNAGKPSWSGDADSTPDVRAWDADNDLRDGAVTAQTVVDHLRELPGLASVLRFMIYNRKMYHEQDDFRPTGYDGPSPHTEHIHFEGAYTEAADRNATFDYRLTELTMNEQSIADKVATDFRSNLDNLSDSERNRLTSVVDAKLAGRFVTLSKLVTDLGAVVATQSKVIDAMSTKIDKLAVGGVDIAALAKATNDDASRRLQQ